MYCVIRGTMDSAVEETDFNVFGPFATKEAAHEWAEQFDEAYGENMDGYVVERVLSPEEELATERRDRAEAEAAENAADG